METAGRNGSRCNGPAGETEIKMQRFVKLPEQLDRGDWARFTGRVVVGGESEEHHDDGLPVRRRLSRV